MQSRLCKVQVTITVKTKGGKLKDTITNSKFRSQPREAKTYTDSMICQNKGRRIQTMD